MWSLGDQRPEEKGEEKSGNAKWDVLTAGVDDFVGIGYRIYILWEQRGDYQQES
jgi:hypothetical protein